MLIQHVKHVKKQRSEGGPVLLTPEITADEVLGPASSPVSSFLFSTKANLAGP